MDDQIQTQHKKRKRSTEDQLEKIFSNSENDHSNKIAIHKSFLLSYESYWKRIQDEEIDEILKKDKDFSFGNYDRYYYNRYLEALKDPRMNLFRNEWFNDKSCLDIGCNDGTLSILIAITYQPKLIEAIDIDYRLVNKSIKNMKYVMRNNINKQFLDNSKHLTFKDNECINLVDEILQNDNNGKKINEVKKSNEEKFVSSEINEQINKKIFESKDAVNKSKLKEILSKMESLPKSFMINLGIPQNKIHKMEQLQIISAQNQLNFPENIRFSQENYVRKLKDNTEQYDTILCLSVVKWIHLNYGDVGVKVLFFNIYNQLKEGGIFIFEPQCFKSYMKKRNLNERIKENYKSIKLKPECFQKYLEETFNFKCIAKLFPPNNCKKTFERPIFVFQK